MIKIIKITKDEATVIRAKHPSTHITVTNRQANAKKKNYYMAEEKAAMRTIRDLRRGGSR